MIESSSSSLKPTNGADFAYISLADCKEKFPQVKKVFTEVMAPIYGEQQDLLSDVEKRRDRKTEILTYRGKDVGCIVYKRDLTKNRANQDASEYLEVSLVALFDPVRDSSKGYRTKLLKRIEEVAKELRADAICYTLPTKLEDHIQYFVHKNFERKDLAQTGPVTECMLVKTLEQKRRKVAKAAPAPLPAQRINELTLKNQYIDPIRKGVKTIEGRINSGAPKNFKVGELLRLFSGNNSVTSTITNIEEFNSFREMLEATGFKKCIPEARDLEAAVKIYDSIQGYNDRAKKNGVLAIHLADPK